MVEEQPKWRTEAAADATVDLGQMLDLATPWCLHVAATLRIPEHISAGRTGITELAAAAGCDRDALHAVLGHLAARGVFAEDSPGRFTCNRAAEQLSESNFLDLDGIGGRMAHTWGTLLDYVRTGQPAYQQVFGRPFWEDLAAHPRIAAEFDALMGPVGHGIPDFDIELSDGMGHTSAPSSMSAAGPGPCWPRCSDATRRQEAPSSTSPARWPGLTRSSTASESPAG